jgi:hypothetical protein
MPQDALPSMPTLQPTRSSDGQRSSVMLEVRGHPFQAVFVCLPTGELSDAAIHGTRADPMTPEQRIELETEARMQAAELRAKHSAELLAGMSVVRVDELLQCVSDAPSVPASGDEHRLAGWDALTGADEARTPPLAHPVLSASDYQGKPAWRFWGTLDVQVADDASTDDLADHFRQNLGARAVAVRSIWLGRPEICAFF